MKVLSKDNYVYTFVRKPTNEQIVIRVEETVFPEKFFEMRMKAKAEDATPKDKKAFGVAKQQLKDTFLSLSTDKLFEFERR